MSFGLSAPNLVQLLKILGVKVSIFKEEQGAGVTSIITEQIAAEKAADQWVPPDSGIHEAATGIALWRTKDSDDKIGCFCLMRLAQMGLACFMFHVQDTSAIFPGQRFHCLQAKGLCVRGR